MLVDVDRRPVARLQLVGRSDPLAANLGWRRITKTCQGKRRNEKQNCPTAPHRLPP
jgi:hypothetical protein